MRIALYSRQLKTEDLAFVQSMLSTLEAHQIQYLLYVGLFKDLGGQVVFASQPDTFSTYETLAGKADYLFSIGGDGTLLNTIMLVKDSKIPVLGINSGRLGFLTDINKDEFTTDLLMLLKNKQYELDNRSVIKLKTNDPELFADAPYALNEFTVHKLDSSAMITVHTFVDGRFLNSYWADGVIVATPTGSTAYSLSCGGPIVYPNSQNFVITPVAPHNLNVRPIVIPDHKTISFKIEGRSDTFLCTLDSRSESINHNIHLEVSKEKFEISLLRLSGNDFFSTLRNKLMWGVDSRN